MTSDTRPMPPDGARVTSPVTRRDRASLLRLSAVGLLGFVLLSVRFSPNWLEYYRDYKVAYAQATNPAERSVIDNGFATTIPVTRSVHVMRQVNDLGARIDDTNHKIVRWRLLFPLVGHFLHLPEPVVLGLAQVGCIIFVVALCTVGPWQPRATVDALGLALVAGATAPFFTSMGWLGYYDAWLATALLIVAFTRIRWLVLLACVLGPWVDERMVIGLPLALCVRWAAADASAADKWTWFRHEAIPPTLLMAAFAGLRIWLGGSGGSQSVRDYWAEFVFARSFDVERILIAAWEGLRFGWLFFLYIAIEGIRRRRTDPLRGAQLLSATVIALLTAAMGLLSALDMSRSMMLLIPIIPLGWDLAARSDWWTRRPYLRPLFAAASLAVPAHHVVSRFIIPVDNLWSTPTAVGEAFNNIGGAYSAGNGVEKDQTTAAKWFRLAEEHGSAVARTNLGILYQNGLGVPKDPVEGARFLRLAAEQGDAAAQSLLGRVYVTGNGVGVDHAEALKWFRRAARQGHHQAQRDLGAMYSMGLGVQRDPKEALKWFRRAAAQGNTEAMTELGDIYALGVGVPKDAAVAVNWYRKAAARGNSRAQSNLGVMYASGDGIARDELEALAWFYLAAAGGDSAAAQLVARAESKLNEERLAQARRRSQELAENLHNSPR